ncbi:MAG: BamA/TamA family outer membrane protein, partial [Deltaproteobacteria bacterium]|nr:BamA/TamA family outer membrane protein [Deltaproteobacteria bacterium]
TEHFNIHYTEGLEVMAREAAAIFEQVHDDLAIRLGWEVDGPTEVIITDSTDSANGSAMAAVRPTVRLYATSPSLDSSLSNHDQWLRTLIVHEYTHIVHLQIHDGLSRFIDAIFGDVYLPNQVQPRWFVEGLAVLDETHETTAGRIRSAEFRMTVRTAALEGTLLTLGELSNDVRQFPRGSDDYIYGAMFLEYLRTRFGMEKIVDICHRYGSAPVPFGMNRIFKEALGVDLVTVYGDFLASVKAEAEAVRARLEAEGLTLRKELTYDGEYKGQPIFAPDGRSLLVGISTGLARSGIYRVPLDGSPRTALALAGASARLSLDLTGRLFYTRTAPTKNAYRYSEVFALDTPGREPRRVTYGARAREAAISPAGDRLAMVLNNAGTTRLMLADDRGNVLRPLFTPEPPDQVYAPSWSPDGKSVAFVVREGPRVDVALVDVATLEVRRLTRDRAIDNTPVFDPTGRYVVFSSDRTGIDNIYAYDLASDHVAQLTNVLTGATAPAVSPRGDTLAYVEYSSRGYDVSLAPFAPDTARPAPLPPADPADPAPLPLPSTAEARAYNPLPSMLPRHWMLSFSTGESSDAVVKVVTSMSDAAARHSAGLELDYGLKSSTLSTRLGYAYGGLGPGLHFGVSRSVAPRGTGYEVAGEPRDWWQETVSGRASLSVPILGTDRSQSLSIGYSVIRARPWDEPEIAYDPEGDTPVVPREYFRTGLEFGWALDTTISSPYGITSEEGREVSASVDLYHPALGGDQTLATFRYAWTEYLRTPWLDHHVFVLKLSGGVHVSDPPEQASFSAGGYAQQNVVDAIMGESSAGTASLRGYPPGRFQGDQIHSARLEYRFPIWFPEAAYNTVPAFFSSVRGGVFSDNVLITFDGLNRDDWKSSVGAEIACGFAVGYYVPMSLRVSYARGLMDGGIHEVVVLVGSGL